MTQMNIPAKMTKLYFLLTSLCVAFGGGLGAFCRFVLSEALAHFCDTAGYINIMIVNVIGSFLIGFLFLIFEAKFRKDGKTRLHGTIHQKHLQQHHGLFSVDKTLQAVDYFFADQILRFISAITITGFLGGFTTFSSFAFYSVKLWQQGLITALLCNLLLSVILGLFAVIFGMFCAKKFIYWQQSKII